MKSKIKLWKWEKKPRTMFRFIKDGDIFCFKLDKDKYCFGRILIKFSIGHVIQVFDVIKSEPMIDECEIDNAGYFIPYTSFDTYGIFDRRIEADEGADWRIIGHDPNFELKNGHEIIFRMGVLDPVAVYDMTGREEWISRKEAEHYPEVVAYGDNHIKEKLYRFGVKFNHKPIFSDANMTDEECVINKTYLEIFELEDSFVIKLHSARKPILAIGRKMREFNKKIFMNSNGWRIFLEHYLGKYHPELRQDLSFSVNIKKAQCEAIYPLNKQGKEKGEKYIEVFASLIASPQRLYDHVIDYGDEINWE